MLLKCRLRQCILDLNALGFGPVPAFIETGYDFLGSTQDVYCMLLAM